MNLGGEPTKLQHAKRPRRAYLISAGGVDLKVEGCDVTRTSQFAGEKARCGEAPLNEEM